MLCEPRQSGDTSAGPRTNREQAGHGRHRHEESAARVGTAHSRGRLPWRTSSSRRSRPKRSAGAPAARSSRPSCSSSSNAAASPSAIAPRRGTCGTRAACRPATRAYDACKTGTQKMMRNLRSTPVSAQDPTAVLCTVPAPGVLEDYDRHSPPARQLIDVVNHADCYSSRILFPRWTALGICSRCR